MGLLIGGLVGLAAAATVIAAAAPASAESRLFTVRTDSPEVTIVRAVRNGQDLQVAGQSGGATFFRIDNPAGAVPCTNTVAFTASTGRILDVTADFCANNWELVLGVAAAAPAAPAPAVAVPAPQVPLPGIGQPVVIATDDPNVTITDVFLRGRPVPINARQGRYVRIVAPTGPAGIECQRDLGLALSDGRRIARLVDICQSNYLVVVPLTGGPRPPPPPAAFVPQPTEPLPAPLPQLPEPVPPAPTNPSQPDFIANMQWMFDPTGQRASLHYAIPNSEISEFSASCAAGSGTMTVTLNRAPATARPGQQVAVRITAGGYSNVHTATMGPVSEITSRSHPVMQIAATDGIWPAIARESVLSIAMNGVQPYGLSLRGSAAATRPFLAFCAPRPVAAPTPIPPADMPGPSANAIGFYCSDGSFISVAFDATSAVVTEPGMVPVVLFRGPPSEDGALFLAGSSQLLGRAEEIYWTRDGGMARTCVRN